MKRLRVEAEVYNDLAEAADWYEAEQPGLADRFLSAMKMLFTEIQSSPEHFRILSGGVRVAWRKPFPFKVYFLVDGEELRVFAVIHASRHPRTWQRKRDERLG